MTGIEIIVKPAPSVDAKDEGVHSTSTRAELRAKASQKSSPAYRIPSCIEVLCVLTVQNEKCSRRRDLINIHELASTKSCVVHLGRYERTAHAERGLAVGGVKGKSVIRPAISHGPRINNTAAHTPMTLQYLKEIRRAAHGRGAAHAR
ncbi:hypothetical protein EVAR_94591_1 [Eumeta japonica]|uniref:Uncharacterized protein n=1 Tax=Eumeta variegata TaxID=151549 RepID=A0A4C1UUT7_EUMVA|nr:hypothetical protein EVAR_94591_1 [Eumeta japonica]